MIIKSSTEIGGIVITLSHEFDEIDSTPELIAKSQVYLDNALAMIVGEFKWQFTKVPKVWGKQ